MKRKRRKGKARKERKDKRRKENESKKKIKNKGKYIGKRSSVSGLKVRTAIKINLKST